MSRNVQPDRPAAKAKPVKKAAPTRPPTDPAKTIRRTPRGASGSHIYERLREQILSLELKPGAPLEEAKLAQALGGSRTPLREALIRLAAEGLVEVLPNRGARVSGMELPQLQEHLEAFELLQRTATVLAAQRRPAAAIAELRRLCDAFEQRHAEGDVSGMIEANWDFHHAIGVACGNRYIERMYDTTLTDGLRISRLAMALECYGSNEAYSLHMNDILREHRELVDVIERRDAAAAAVLSDSHSNLARLRVSDYLARSLTRGISLRFPAEELSRV